MLLFAGLGLMALAGVLTGVGLCCYFMYPKEQKDSAAADHQELCGQPPIPMAVSVSMTEYGQPESNWPERPLGHPLHQPAGVVVAVCGPPQPTYPGAAPQQGEAVFAHCQKGDVAIAHPIGPEGKSAM